MMGWGFLNEFADDILGRDDGNLWLGARDIFSGRKLREEAAGLFDDDEEEDAATDPELELELPPPIEAPDTVAVERYTKQNLQRKKGRRSTILTKSRSGSKLGSTNTGRKTVLG